MLSERAEGKEAGNTRKTLFHEACMVTHTHTHTHTHTNREASDKIIMVTAYRRRAVRIAGLWKACRV